MVAIGEWIARITAEGVSYYPADGRSVGGARIVERIRPMLGVETVVRAEVARMRDAKIFHDARLGPVEDLRTDDGEYAALMAVTAKGTADGKPVLYIYGFVFGDDFYNRIDGWMTDVTRFGELDDVVRSAIKTNHLCLGPNRHRRFFYQPPAGWQSLQRGPLLTEWYPLDFPKHHARLSVPSAFTEKMAPALVEALMARRMLSFKAAGKPVREPLKINGLNGLIEYTIGEFPGSEELLFTHVIHAAVRDSKYTYVVRLDTTARYLDGDRHRLFDVLKSIQGIPSKGNKDETAAAMSWVID